ncbi:MAG: gfo/Idh/MocA family oxidoreductase, partial [Planctomycetales bacterium]|nr:gfo/Idh/MocA family oxidoreductase [Planctomycetales bacterium]
ENVKATFERTLGHLRDNNVKTDNLDIQVGLHLPLDPKTETFKGNSQADQMLTRDYRAPFVVPSAANV